MFTRLFLLGACSLTVLACSDDDSLPDTAAPTSSAPTQSELGIRILVGNDRRELVIPPVGFARAGAGDATTPASTDNGDGTATTAEPLTSEETGTVTQPLTDAGNGTAAPVDVRDQGGTPIDLASFPGKEPGWLLSYAAAKQCRMEFARSDRPIPPYATRIREEPWGFTDSTAWYHYGQKGNSEGQRFTSCDDVLYHEELTLCIADKLASIADAVGPLTWDGPGWSGSGWDSIQTFAAYNDTWVIPPQKARDRFIVRDLAINALAHLARLDLEVPTDVHGNPSPLGECAGAYSNAMLDVIAPADQQFLFGVAEGQIPQYFPPDWIVTNSPADIAEYRLVFRAQILRAGARLLRKLIGDSVYADLAGAEQARASAGDPARGAEYYWGIRDTADAPYNSIQHALRVLFGRWELGPPKTSGLTALEFRAPRGDPKCDGVSWNDLIERLKAFDARWSDRPVRTEGQSQAVAVLEHTGIVLSPKDVDEQGIDAARSAIKDQLLLDAALERGLTSTSDLVNGVPFSSTPTAQAVSATIEKVEDGDLHFAIDKAFHIYQLLTGRTPDEPVIATAGLTAKTSGVSSSITGFGDGAIVLDGGLPRSDVTADVMARLGGAQAASQCLEYHDINGLNPSNGRLNAFQNVFMIGDTFRQRLSYTAKLGVGDEGKTLRLAEAGNAEIRAWTGPGRIFVTSPKVTSSFATQITVSLAGFTFGDLGMTDPGTEEGRDEEINEQLALVYGDATTADCVAGVRTACNNLDLTAAVIPLVDQGYTTNLGGFEDRVFFMTFNRTQISTATAEGTASPKYLYVIQRADPVHPGRGKVLAALAPHYRNSPGNAPYQTITEVVSDFQRDLANKVLGFNQELSAEVDGIGDGDMTSSPTYCIDKVPRDFFVPLENELTSDSDEFEDSWRHYLDLARQAATKTDELGQEIIRLGLEKDLRREAAGEELADICGDFAALDKTTVADGEVSAPDDDQALAECLNEPKTDVVFLTNDSYGVTDATQQIKQLYLGCGTQPPLPPSPGPGTANPLCEKGVISHAGLNLATYVPGAAAPTSRCGDSAIEAINLVGSTGVDSVRFSSLAVEDGLDPIGIENALAGITVTVDLNLDWDVQRDGHTIMSTKPSTAPATCGLMQNQPCPIWPNCGSNCSEDPIATRFAAIFGSPLATEPTAIKDELLQRVTGAIWLMGAMSGTLPARTFTVPTLVANFSAGARDPEYAPLIYGNSTFDSSYNLVGGRTTSEDTKALPDLTPLNGAYANAINRSAGTPMHPAWVKEAYAAAASAIGTNPAAYLVAVAASTPRSFPPIQLDKGVADTQLAKWIQTFAEAAASGSSCSLPNETAAALYDQVKYPDSVAELCVTTNKAHPLLASHRNTQGFISDIFFYNTDKSETADDIIPGWSASTTKGRLRENSEWGDALAPFLPSSELACRHNRDGFYPKISSACLPLYQTGGGGDGYTRFTQDALRPGHGCNAGDRAQLFVNSNNPLNVCEMAEELGRALALSCVMGGEYRVLKLDDPLPVLTEPKDLQKFEDWLGYQELKAKVLVGQLSLQALPTRVTEDIARGTVGAGAIKGEHGQLILQLEDNIRAITKLLNSVELGFSQLKLAVNGARIGLKGVELAKDKELAQVAIQRFQLIASTAQAVAQAAEGAVAPFQPRNAVGGAVSGTADIAAAGTTIACNLEAMGELSDIEDITASEAVNNVAGVMNDLQEQVGPLFTELKNSTEDLKIAVSQVLALSSALNQNENKAKYQAAKGSGADFVEVEGETVLFPVNTVLNRQYDIAQRRYEESLNNTKRLAYFARLAIEQRIGQRLQEIDEAVGALEAPSTWADDICSFQGVDYEALSSVTTDENGNVIDTKLAEEFADPFVGDYVDKLEAFVEYYNIEYPSQEADDTAVLSLRDDLVGASESCYEESKNLLYFSDSLGSGQAAADAGTPASDAPNDPILDVPPEAIQGWQVQACGPSESHCLIVSSGETLLDAGGDPQAPPQVSPVGGVTWLHDEAYAGETIDADATAGAPARSVYQFVELRAGTRYALSWWDMARSATGEPSLGAGGGGPGGPGGPGGGPPPGPTVEYSTSVYGPAWEIVATTLQLPYYEAGGGVWSPRRELVFTAPTDGTFRIAFMAGLPGQPGSIAIADVQLEEAGVSGGATSYEATDSTRNVMQPNCVRGNSAALRDLFDYKCEEGECFYELRDPILIAAEELDDGESRFSGKIARGNFNFRHLNVALNVVGTGVLDCSSVGTDSCYGSGYVEYTLDHDAFATSVIDYLGDSREFNFGSATIHRGKALTSERYITLPISSADQELLAQPQTQKPEFRGRPLTGSYRFRIYDSPALAWDQLEDVQLILNYRYWSRVRRESATGG